MSSIGVIFGGPSPEHDISILTGLQASLLLLDSKHDVVCLYWTKSSEWLRVDGRLEASAFVDGRPPGAAEVDLLVPGGFTERRRRRQVPVEVDVVLNCCHGGPGEDGTLAGLLSAAGLRVTGPSAEACAVAMDKLAMGALAIQAGVPAIPTVPLTASTEAIDLPAPWVVKPRFGGSSLGVETGVVDIPTARALAGQGASRAGAIAQPFLEGWTDLNIAARRHPTIMTTAIERPRRDTSPILDYKSKYLAGSGGMESMPRDLPASLPSDVQQRIEHQAALLIETAGLTGIPRIDFLWDGADEVLFCEVNSIPGALGLYLWEASGVSRLQAIEDLVAEALVGPAQPPQWAASSDGAALRVAGTIASKLA